ncbi:nicotinamide riboside transporter PnuC [Pseudomonas nitritireducens]|uniref:Nicotinamide riboside transporter PnuC n=1 Tax=Pseudomonas nitroreducens TaxID=46680 RepID=A0A7W7KF55_PSENT|nr:nicotinamide mononucleotide transporter [Pseudomonas nitritireducens]MBB4861271.1 nicotinamide riboside transporter PnuC [Pseudomonas nitritireducens]
MVEAECAVVVHTLYQTVTQWVGTVFGVVGALMVASNTRWSKWGWPFFIVSAWGLFLFAGSMDAFGMMILEVTFFLTNLLGLWRWLIQPYRESKKETQKHALENH